LIKEKARFRKSLELGSYPKERRGKVKAFRTAGRRGTEDPGGKRGVEVLEDRKKSSEAKQRRRDGPG